jgi:septal ring factor EnvC (AmiA/AmiB activator)
MKDPCQKIKYLNEENAWYQLNKINSINHTELNNVYFCKECKAYHLTRQKSSKDNLLKQIENLKKEILDLNQKIIGLNQRLDNKSQKYISNQNKLNQKIKNQKKIITGLMKKDNRFEHLEGLINLINSTISDDIQ